MVYTLYTGRGSGRVGQGKRSEAIALKYALMGLLAEGPMHGYELKGAYEDQLAPHSQLNFGQVYTTLERLKKDGWINGEEIMQPDRPNKKVYSLTDVGRTALEEWLEASELPRQDLRNTTLAKIVLAQRLPGFDPARVIARERKHAFAKLQEIQHVPRAGEAAPAELLLDLAALQLEAYLHWLDKCDAAFPNHTSE